MKLGEKELQRIEHEKQKKIKTNLLALDKYGERLKNEEITIREIRGKIEQRANINFKWN